MMKNSSIVLILKWVCVMIVMVKWVSANSEVDALITLKNSLTDPDGVLESWNPQYVDACTFLHIMCDDTRRHVTRIDLGDQNLSGELVPDLGTLEYLQYMELSKNNIQGTIPSELGNLANLIVLDLYNNNISGSIPAELGKLQSLEIMRLNDNKLTGPIPMELTNLAILNELDLSSNDLSGKIPTTGAFAHLGLANFTNNPRLEGSQLLGLAAYTKNA